MSCCGDKKVEELRAAGELAPRNPVARRVARVESAVVSTGPGAAADEPAWRKAICEVHRRLDGDHTTPRLSRFCRVCNAWICQECWNNWARRARAFVRGKGRRK